MEADKPDIQIADVVESTAGKDKGKLFYCVGTEGVYLLLANGKDRSLDQPKRKKLKHVNKVLRAETRVAAKIRSGDKVLNSELRKDLAFFSREINSHNQGG